MRRVVITGMGAVTPVGLTLQETWQALLAGKSGAGLTQSFDTTRFTSKISAEVPNFDPAVCLGPKEIKRTERFVQFAIAACKQAVEDSGIDIAKEDPWRCGVIIGSGIGSMHLMEEQRDILVNKGPEKLSPFLIPMLIVNMASGQAAITFGFKGPNSCTATACASGAHGVGEAYRLIHHGYADIMLGGGTEACITPLAVGGFCALRALSTRNDDPQRASRPFDKDRDGFVIGEGAGILLLEEYEHAKKRGAKIYAEMVGYKMTADAYHMTAPADDGSGAAKAMELAIKDARINSEDVDYINAHGTSTGLNDKTETLAIKTALGGHARKVAVSSTKSMTGHLIGAAGGLEAAVAALAVQNDVIPPTINYTTPDPDCDLDYVPNHARQTKVRYAMSNSLGFGGHNATVVVKKFEG